MIRFEHTEVVGWEHAIRGMRNPMNSWDKSDSKPGCRNSFGDIKHCDGNGNELGCCIDWYECHGAYSDIIIGPDDLALMKKLIKAGSDHRKFMRMIAVYVDITAPLYWWKEFDTYKVGTVANSCSTMHKIHAKEFTVEDFSTDHMRNIALSRMDDVLLSLNGYRSMYLHWEEESDNVHRYFDDDKKNVWWQMIQLLPSSYNQKRTVMLNYEVLRNMYHARNAHKLDEWREGFCKWVEGLPYAELITGGNENESV